MSSLKGYALSLLIFIVTLSGLLYVWESRMEKKFPAKVSEPKSYEFKEYGTDIGFFPRAGSDLVSTFRNGNEIIYQVRYQTDARNLRIPLPENEKANLHVIFAGCSLVFGEGLPVEETLSWNFQKTVPGVEAVNLGHMGGGLHTLLRWTELFSLKDLGLPEKGHFLYFFFPDHLNRFFLRINYLQWGDPGSPVYEERNGKIVYAGPLRDTQRFKSVRMLSEAGMKHVPLRADPPLYESDELRIFAAGIKELKARVKKQLPQSEFSVVFFPFGTTAPEGNQSFIEELKKAGIDFYESSPDFSEGKESLSIPGDGHPNFRFNQLMTEVIQKWKSL